MNIQALRPNYYALVLAILKKKSVQKACTEMGIPISHQGLKLKRKSNLDNFTVKEIKEVIKLKEQGWTWKELENKYGVIDKVLFQKVKKFMGDDWENRRW